LKEKARLNSTTGPAGIYLGDGLQTYNSAMSNSPSSFGPPGPSCRWIAKTFVPLYST
jgi:hypothetical protein